MISPSLKRRVLSAIFLLPIIILIVWQGSIIFKIAMGIAFGIAIKEWLRMARLSNHRLRDAFVGLVYIFIGFFAFILIRTEYDEGLFYTFILLAGVWTSDSFAYFSGKWIGGPKLAPKISPNKTWAGLIGGTIGSALMLLAIDYFAPRYGAMIGLDIKAFATLPVAFGIGALITILGQIGDLGMSVYKRKVGVKDTGTLIPGHGGILDRIDSLILVTPFFLLFIMEIN